MRVIYFCYDTADKTLAAYNKWAEGKPLTRDVIIHTHTVLAEKAGIGTLIIMCFFDEKLHPSWVGQDDIEA
jgi:hypothetical protein